MLLARTVQKYTKTASKLATWREMVIPEGLTVFATPPAHWQRLRTVNGLERLNQEIRRRTRVVGVFPNEALCLRLVSVLAMDASDEWEAGNSCLLLFLSSVDRMPGSGRCQGLCPNVQNKA